MDEAERKRLQVACGQRLARARAERKQTILADALGVSRTSVSNIERGKQRLYLDHLYAAARDLGVPLEKLLPPLEEIFPARDLLTAADDPPSQEALSDADRVVAELRSTQGLSPKEDAHAPFHPARSKARTDQASRTRRRPAR